MIPSPETSQQCPHCDNGECAECRPVSKLFSRDALELPLTFRQFQALNADRCKWNFKHHGRSSDWTIFDWALAIAGESGELCNLLKKVRRGDFPLEQVLDQVKAELVDIITYCDATLNELQADTGHELIRKFDEVSQRPEVRYDRHNPLCFGCHRVRVNAPGDTCEYCLQCEAAEATASEAHHA